MDPQDEQISCQKGISHEWEGTGKWREEICFLSGVEMEKFI